ncbi:hypothetical protein V8E54_003374 [Elaphomyces granulatus]
MPPDDELEVIIHAHAVDRHPGNAADPIEYVIHLPEASAPVVTFLGVVVEQSGKLNEGPNLLHYILRVTVYDTATRNTVSFQIAAYFKNGRRWINFPTLSLHTAVFITRHVFGVTRNNPIRLAVLIEDVHFMPVSVVLVQKRMGMGAATTVT